MKTCPTCDRPIAPGIRVCPSCATRLDEAEPGEALDSDELTRPASDASQQPTSPQRPPAISRPPEPPRRTGGSGDPGSGERFVPGTVIAGRYRIVGLLGRGGMGEVYRADDLELGEPVALKFLPPEVTDGTTLALFRREVKVARSIAHPNICRVYDIGEVEGQVFLSMEFIDGEDLASLLRRIGRLPPAKALQIARQLCAGLSAAHEQGVLHRDLKPANVMVDGRGRAKITDFGIAGLEHDFGERHAVEGTPAYQAPEQLLGREVTARSDLYALGLVMYEMFTGVRPFKASTRSELIRLQTAAEPPRPSSRVSDVDPLAEKAILACLAPRASDRPRSAVQVSTLLPGGDPLAAALAAGETPSPEMVAAAPRKGRLSWPAAAAGMAVVLVGLLFAGFLQQRVFLEHRVAPRYSPSELAFRAEQVADRLGAGFDADDEAFGWTLEPRAFARLPAAPPGEPRGDIPEARPPLLSLWYRSSPEPMATLSGHVLPDDPPLVHPGDLQIRVDPRGRLWRFDRVPDRAELTPAGEGSDDLRAVWRRLFTEAGLDLAGFEATAPRWEPPQRSDLRAAWLGVHPDDPELELRVEAAALRGEPVWFEVLEAGAEPVDMEPGAQGMAAQLFWWLIGLFYVLVIGASVLLARRNLNEGKGDRRGALRLAVVLLVTLALEAVVASHHVGGLAELRQLMRLLAEALFSAACLWIGYVALEPLIRRRWPQRIIGWSRALGGDLSDPMVGREVLLGSLVGLAMALAGLAAVWALPLPEGWVYPAELDMWMPGGWTKVGSWLAGTITASIVVPVSSLLFVVLLAYVVRRLVYAGLVYWFLLSLVLLLGTGGTHPVLMLQTALVAALFTLVLTQVGLLAACVAHAVLFVAGTAPMTFDPSTWYFPFGLAGALLVVALAGYGATVSLGGPAALRSLVAD